MLLEWVELNTEGTKDYRIRNMPVWLRSAAVERKTKTVFIPAIIGEHSERAMLLKALHDGQSICYHSGHLFVPADWLMLEYPDAIPCVDTIKKRVLERAV